MRTEVRLWDLALTVCRRRDARLIARSDEELASVSARLFLADKFRWSSDPEVVAQLCELLDLRKQDQFRAVLEIELAVESGELVTIPDAPSSALSAHRDSANEPRPRSVTFTPSQLFPKRQSVPVKVAAYEPPPPRRYSRNDFFAIMAANPGDVLPDGTIATAFSEAEPFGFVPRAPSDDVFEVTARGMRITGNEPGGFRVNLNGLDVDYFDSNGNLCAQYHGSHGGPHGHNFSGGVRDDAHLPMSSIKCE